MMTTPPHAEAASSLAAGEGVLVFRTRANGSKTSIETIAARSPLKLLAPKNHGSFAWVFAANFGGGLVCGDHLNIRAHVHEGACALLGTQSATKVYKSEPGANGSRQTLTCTVDDGASLVVLPDPVSTFEGARYEQRNDIRLGPGASLVLLDGYTCGRRHLSGPAGGWSTPESARGERWAFSRYLARTRIEREGRIFAVDATLLDPAHGVLPTRMSRFDAFATLIVTGLRFASVAEHARESAAPLARRADVIVSANALGDDGAIVRIGGVSVEQVTLAVRAALRDLPAALGDDPFARKF